MDYEFKVTVHNVTQFIQEVAEEDGISMAQATKQFPTIFAEVLKDELAIDLTVEHIGITQGGAVGEESI